MMPKNFMTAALTVILAVALPSCNKDEVIDGSDGPDDGVFRPATSHSSAFCNRVYE